MLALTRSSGQAGRLPYFVLPLVALLLAAGCDREEVRTYRVETNNITPAAPLPASAALPMANTAETPALKYLVPAGWQEQPASEMRAASFVIAENGRQADVSVIPLVGMAGGDLANVNRWLGQIGQPPVTASDLPKLSEAVEIAGQSASLYNLAGGPNRILAAVLHRGDTTWFFKVTGGSELVAKHKAAFVAFLKSVQFAAPPPSPKVDE